MPKTVWTMAQYRTLKVLTWTLAALALACFGYAGWVFLSRQQDESAIRAAVAGQIISKPGTGLFVEEVTDWVYQNQGFAKNPGYYHWQALGPTPRQVLEWGGDCADKSRLMSAILRQHGVDSSLVTLLGCDRCGPTHVVVEARYREGWMVADPVFDLVFPKDEFTYHGVADLREDPNLLLSRLNGLVQQQGPLSKVSKYRRNSETYTYAQYVNWEKVPFAKPLAALLRPLGIDLFALRRPWFLEDPKFLLGSLGAGAGSLFALLAVLGAWLARRRAPGLLTNGPAGTEAGACGRLL
jgi:hypothetical protein